MALCQQGDEAVAVGLLGEALPDGPVESCGVDVTATAGARADDADPAAAAAGASSLLRKVSRCGMILPLVFLLLLLLLLVLLVLVLLPLFAAVVWSPCSRCVVAVLCSCSSYFGVAVALLVVAVVVRAVMPRNPHPV